MNNLKAYCINLDSRPDRWQLAQEQFVKQNVHVERFPAIDAKDFRSEYPCDNANNGCTLSHYFIVERAKLLGLDAVLIFEDDVQLEENFTTKLSDRIDSLPANWDMLYLGGSHREKPETLPSSQGRLLRVRKTLTTHAYILRSSMYERVLESFTSLHQPVDCYYAEWQWKCHVFVTNPPLAWQRKSFSNIAGREMDYPWIQSNEQ